MKELILTISITISSSVFAEKHSLATVTSSEDSAFSKLILETDDDSDEAKALIVQSFSSSKKLIETKKFKYRQINDQGAVLSKEQGREVVVIDEIDFDPSSGGSVNLDYLSSGISGKRESFEIGIKKLGDSWKLFDLDENRSFTKMHFEARKAFGKTVGIKEIQLH